MSCLFWLWLCLGLPPLLLVNAKNSKNEQRSYRFLIHEFTMTTSRKDLFEELNCKVTQSRYVNCNVTFSRNIYELTLEASLDIMNSNNKTMRLFNARLDGCQFLTTIHKNALFRMIAKSLLGSIKGSINCPIVAHFNYKLDNFALVETDFPNYMPENQFKVIIKYITDNAWFLRIFLHGSTQHKN